MTDRLDPLYRQNPDYQPQYDGTFWILSNAEGWGLACDEPVYRIWSSFDGRTTEEVVGEVSAETGVSQADLDARLAELKELEARLITEPDPQFRFHSGSPAEQ